MITDIINCGGEHYYDTENKTYTIKRKCGLFSNISVSVYGIVKLFSIGMIVDVLVLKLDEYELNFDFYPYLYKNSGKELLLNEVPYDEILSFLENCKPSTSGLGANDLNFNILDKIYKKFFTLNHQVLKMKHDIILKNHINFKKTVFIWARKTDKQIECTLPDVNDYIELIKKYNLTKKEIILQTDDDHVYDEFMSYKHKLNIRILNEIQSGNKAFHIDLYKVDNSEFQKKYGYNKIEYLQKLICLAEIAAKSRYYIIYPGNLNFYIPFSKSSNKGLIK
jgi:hypothetical protein